MKRLTMLFVMILFLVATGCGPAEFDVPDLDAGVDTDLDAGTSNDQRGDCPKDSSCTISGEDGVCTSTGCVPCVDIPHRDEVSVCQEHSDSNRDADAGMNNSDASDAEDDTDGDAGSTDSGTDEVDDAGDMDTSQDADTSNEGPCEGQSEGFACTVNGGQDGVCYQEQCLPCADDLWWQSACNGCTQDSHCDSDEYCEMEPTNPPDSGVGLCYPDAPDDDSDDSDLDAGTDTDDTDTDLDAGDTTDTTDSGDTGGDDDQGDTGDDQDAGDTTDTGSSDAGDDTSDADGDTGSTDSGTDAGDTGDSDTDSGSDQTVVFTEGTPVDGNLQVSIEVQNPTRSQACLMIEYLYNASDSPTSVWDFIECKDVHPEAIHDIEFEAQKAGLDGVLVQVAFAHHDSEDDHWLCENIGGGNFATTESLSVTYDDGAQPQTVTVSPGDTEEAWDHGGGGCATEIRFSD